MASFPARRALGACGAACSAACASRVDRADRQGPLRPEERPRLTPYVRSPDYPPQELEGNNAAVARWFEQVFNAVPPKESDRTMTQRERSLYTMSAAEYMEARKAGRVTCEEYAKALAKRARYYRYLNQWVFNSYDRLDTMIEQARALDAQAAAEGIDAIGPLYGLPVPMKGTAAVVDYPSGSGVGVLSGYVPVRDSDLTALIKARGGLIFGATNVAEFAAGYMTCNRASGQTRNVYGHHLTVGGSSGGSGSAVAGYMCPLAVTEDTGGSTRAPAAANQNFGFDPARNHFPNGGNPGLTYTHDQLGLNARSVDDILLFTECLRSEATPRGLYADAAARVAARPACSIRIGCPAIPLVQRPCASVAPQFYGPRHALNVDVREKYEASSQALAMAGFSVLHEEWPSAYFDYLGRYENVALEMSLCQRPVNGKPFMGQTVACLSLSGQVAEFVRAYLDAPVSLKEILEDLGDAGASHDPGGLMRIAESVDETQFRYFMGPKIREDCAAYNSFFEKTGADLLLVPAGWSATPDLAACASGAVPLTRLREDGAVEADTTGGTAGDVYGDHMFWLKHLHIPKLVVPTGLTADGRPTAVQLWGRAVPYEHMFDDARAELHDAEFLHLAQRAAAAIQADPRLRRVDAPRVAADLGLA